MPGTATPESTQELVLTSIGLKAKCFSNLIIEYGDQRSRIIHVSKFRRSISNRDILRTPLGKIDGDTVNISCPHCRCVVAKAHCTIDEVTCFLTTTHLSTQTICQYEKKVPFVP